VRSEFRVKWWETAKNQTCRTWIFPDSEDVPELVPFAVPETGYPSDSPPTFFGHYAIRRGQPGPLRPNLACLEFVTEETA